ncbi:universal stress protein [Streptomyces sp. BYX5S]
MGRAVVVGVTGADGARGARAAARWAADEAGARGAPLVVVYAGGAGAGTRGAAVLEGVRADVAGRHPELAVSTVELTGTPPPSRALLARAEDAALLVLGLGPVGGAEADRLPAEIAACSRVPVALVPVGLVPEGEGEGQPEGFGGERVPGAAPERSGGERVPGAAPERSGGERVPGAVPERSGGERVPGAAPERSGGERAPGAEPERSGRERVSVTVPERAGPHRPSGPVTLGVDTRSPADDAATGYAFAAAHRHGLRLHALHAWALPAPTSSEPPRPPWRPPSAERATWEDQEVQALADRLHPWRAKYPSVRVVEDVVMLDPDAALARASADSSLLVVGRRGTGRLGPTVRALLRQARCAVVVSPTPEA